jgi:CMP-N,N'-diacetyllegionaminic acid synthase
MNVLGIIPARGGSKRLKGKNIKNLAGKPMIFYTIASASKSKFINRLVVTTDSKRIASVSKKCGAEILMRPAALATDAAPSLPVFRHVVTALEKKGYKADIAVILQPTSPLRSAADIDSAVEKLISTKKDSVVSVCEACPGSWLHAANKEKIAPAVKGNGMIYKLNGAVYAVKKNALMKKGLITSNTGYIIMPKERSVDIDTIDDFKLTEIAMKFRAK